MSLRLTEASAESEPLSTAILPLAGSESGITRNDGSSHGFILPFFGISSSPTHARVRLCTMFGASEVEEARLRPSVVAYNSAISSCEGEHWHLALDLLRELCHLEQRAPSKATSNQAPECKPRT